MTRHPQSADAPEAKKRNSRPMTAHEAVGKIRGIYADQRKRIADATSAIQDSDDAKARAIVDRVEGSEETDALAVMLHALNIFIPGKSASIEVPADADAEPSDDVPSRPSLEEYDGVPERLREPLSPERLAVARKR